MADQIECEHSDMTSRTVKDIHLPCDNGDLCIHIEVRYCTACGHVESIDEG